MIESAPISVPYRAEEFTDEFVSQIVAKYLAFTASTNNKSENDFTGHSVQPASKNGGNCDLMNGDNAKQKPKILKWTAEKASQDGQNFCSYLARLSVEYSQEGGLGSFGNDEDDGRSVAEPDSKAAEQQIVVKRDFIVKLLPPNAAHRATVMAGELFEKEVEFYSKLIPAMQKIADDSNYPAGRSPRNLFPECYWASACPEQGYILVLQDLCSAGFKPLNPRTEPIGGSNCFQIVARLAEMHALSVALSRNLGGEAAVRKRFPYVCNSFPFASDAFTVTLIQGLLGAVTMLRQLPDQAELADGLEAYIERHDLATRLRESFNLTWDRLGCIAHGDMWSSNIFLKEPSANPPSGVKHEDPSTSADSARAAGSPTQPATPPSSSSSSSQNADVRALRPEDVRLIDFQFSRWGHPAGDLAYLRASSLEPGFWACGKEEVFRRYLKSFYEAADLLGLDLDRESYCTVDDLKKDYRKAAEGSFLVAIVLLPSILAASKDRLDMDKFDLAEIIQTRERQILSGRVEAIRAYLVPLVQEMKELGILV